MQTEHHPWSPAALRRQMSQLLVDDPPPIVNLHPEGAAPLALLCEHASARLPRGCGATAADLAWLHTHWGVDLGAAPLTAALARRLDAPAFLGGVSRLLCDLNRPPGHPDLARAEVEGARLALNAPLHANDHAAAEAARAARVAAWHTPFHAAVDAGLAARRGQLRLLFSVHTFTPLYLGQPRSMGMGVLFDEHDALAEELAAALEAGEAAAADGVEVVRNAPWSGKDGLIYSPQRHGRAQGLPYLELEVRQDLLEQDDQVERIAGRVARALRGLGLLQGAWPAA